MDSLIKAIRQILPDDRVKAKLIDVISYASDAGFYKLLPKVVVQPATILEIQQLFIIAQIHKCPMVFRAGGTSLSGQSITDGILVDISQYWSGIKVSDDGKSATFQPGITGGMVNHFLKKHGSKIGPDPASINAAMMGGILSNNASGMCCGVAYNSYHTLQSICFVLADGKTYNTSLPDDYERFKTEQTVIYEKLSGLRTQVTENEYLLKRIRKKYRLKNTVGYGLNALVDYTHPLDIFGHLLIGAEGTLGFIAEATMLTLPDKPFKAAALLFFKDIYKACAAIIPLKNSGAAAIELMDRASLQSVAHLTGLPDFFPHLPISASAILCEYQTESKAELNSILSECNELLVNLNLLHAATFNTDDYTRNFYWKIRKGMFPSVGAVRQSGSTVILEDIAVPVEKLADAIFDLQNLFKKFEYHDAIIFGHAKDGNIHFVITQLLDTNEEVKRYDSFLRSVVDLILKKYDGSLKAEHGTGRNMAPFVEAEWGGEAYEIMKEIKKVADPSNILNPGVIINKSKNAHLENLKEMPEVEAVVDKCIECGFCEPNCPSKDVTTSPRRRIVVRRALKEMQKKGLYKKAKQLIKEFQYYGLDTCATDGLCATDCPVDINTGELVKRLRAENHGKASIKIAGFMANKFTTVEKMGRFFIRIIATIDQLFKWKSVAKISMILHKIIPAIPIWISEVGKPPKILTNYSPGADLIYFTSCINRLMSNGKNDKPSLQQTFLNLCKKADLEVIFPKNITGHCCGQPFSSKGFNEAALISQTKLIDELLCWSKDGLLPVVIDFTSCTYTLIQNQKYLSAEFRTKFNKLRIIDSIQYLNEYILPKLTIIKKKDLIAIHPVCAATKMLLNQQFINLANNCANEVLLPSYSGCCGMAGDRGFYYPELTAGAVKREVNELKNNLCEGYYASSTTCEISLSQQSGYRYEHIMYLLDEVS